MLIGYARVSTDDQHLDGQRSVLRAAGCQLIYEEKISGAKRKRPELTRLLEHLREGDIVVVSRLDRLARSTQDLLELVDIFQHTSVGLRSLAEPWADTTSPSGKMVLTIFERTSAGRHAAKMKGVRFGRPMKLSVEQVALGRRLISEGRSVRDTARILNCHHATLYRALNNVVGLPDEELDTVQIVFDTNR